MSTRIPALAIFLCLAFPLYANPAAETCTRIDKDDERLACYDSIDFESPVFTDTVLDDRMKQEAVGTDNSFTLIAHHSTYFLPLAYADNPNNLPFEQDTTADHASLENLEVKFQISFRVPINRHFFFRNSDLWFGYTQLSMWQLYNSDQSSPFRETNYEPELIWSFLVNQSLGEIKLTHLNIALNHQSNGRSDPLSRSWNRIYIDTIWAHKKWAFAFRPWYRLPERKSNDDNPDIDDYLGHYDFRAAYREQDHQFSTLMRSTLGSNAHSFYELGYSFSINRKFRGYVQFVNGYGETLLDYNHRNKRFSIGIMLNDWF